MPNEIIWVGTPFILNFKDQRQFFHSLEDQGHEVLIDDCPAYLSEDELVEKIKNATAVIAGAEPYTNKVMEKTPDLKIIARAGVGVNNIDIPSATKNNIVVTNAEGQNSSSVSEHFFGLLINCTLRIHWVWSKLIERRHPLVKRKRHFGPYNFFMYREVNFFRYPGSGSTT